MTKSAKKSEGSSAVTADSIKFGLADARSSSLLSPFVEIHRSGAVNVRLGKFLKSARGREQLKAIKNIQAHTLSLSLAKQK